ncbi:xylose isomerase [Candidatus Poribacteria bacterium]|nr:xylose isomerase [Candidatus Poribacteria bacterium]
MASDGVYCFNTSTIRNCGLGVVEEIRLAAEVGYDGIELWVAEIAAYLQGGGTLADLRGVIDDAGIHVPNLIAFFQWANPDEATRSRALIEAVEVFETAEALGCPNVAAPPMGVTDRTDIPIADLTTYYRGLLDAVRGMHAAPLLEFWGMSKTLGSLSDALAIMRAIDSPEVVLLADVFHMAKAGDSYDLLGELEGAQLGLFHFNDFPGSPEIDAQTDADRVYPGDGAAPIADIVATLRRIGYEGMYSLELFNKSYEEAGAESVARTGIWKMRALLG